MNRLGLALATDNVTDPFRVRLPFWSPLALDQGAPPKARPIHCTMHDTSVMVRNNKVMKYYNERFMKRWAYHSGTSKRAYYPKGAAGHLRATAPWALSSNHRLVCLWARNAAPGAGTWTLLVGTVLFSGSGN